MSWIWIAIASVLSGALGAMGLGGGGILLLVLVWAGWPQMTAQGNLGNDPSDSSDTGVECKIDYDQNILATSQVKIGLRVKPNGYAKYIDVELGFKTA